MDLNDIRPEEIESREQVGWHAGVPVFLVCCTGGISFVFEVRNGKSEVLGHGPHEGVSKGIAKKVEPGIVYTQLAKSDDAVDPNGRIFRRYETATRELRARRYGK